MARARVYLVPVDFSRGSEAALKHAAGLARENRGKLLLVHVIAESLIYPSEGAFIDYFAMAEKDAREKMKRLTRRLRLKPREYRALFFSGGDTARVIANQARRSRAAMIVMGSHGRTGLQRLMIGSVAERTIRYADRPVLIVKK